MQFLGRMVVSINDEVLEEVDCSKYLRLHITAAERGNVVLTNPHAG